MVIGLVLSILEGKKHDSQDVTGIIKQSVWVGGRMLCILNLSLEEKLWRVRSLEIPKL